LLALSDRDYKKLPVANVFHASVMGNSCTLDPPNAQQPRAVLDGAQEKGADLFWSSLCIDCRRSSIIR